MTREAASRADLAAILAGGAGARMGGVDKGAVLLGGRPLHAIVAERLAPQTEALAIAAATAPGWLGAIPGASWIADAPGAKGPAAGLLGALRWLESRQGPEALLLTSPVDAPFLPPDLFEQLDATRRQAGAPAAIVRHEDRLHPVFGVWRAGCAATVERAMVDERALHRIALKAGAVECAAWPERRPESRNAASPDPFANLNLPQDVAAAETFLQSRRS